VSTGVIFVVDDDDALRSLIVETLRRKFRACEVAEAEDGVAAQHWLRERTPDIVVTDINMPRMGGLELIRWGRQERPEVLWVIHSGLETFSAAARAVRLGAFAFIPKDPSSVQLLPATVKQAFERRRLIADRDRLTAAVAEKNAELGEQVARLERACELLHRQTRVIEADLERAKRIQRALLPEQAPVRFGWEFDAIYRPSQHIGGDLYDIAVIDDRTLSVYVADAAGHGVAAAMLSVLFKHHLRLTDKTGRPSPPAAVLARANAALFGECRKHALFLTAAYLVIDTETREVTAAVAGHPAVLKRLVGGAVQTIACTGPALGLEPDARYGEEQTTLREGEQLLLYTDGVLDVIDDGANTPGGSVAEQFAGGDLLEALGRQRSGQQPDDVTALVVGATGAAGRSRLDNADDTTTTMALGLPEPECELLLGTTTNTAVLSIRGRWTWAEAATLMAVGDEALAQGFGLTMDLSRCEYLDSTGLGTIHELVIAAAERELTVTLHQPDHVRGLFVELGMQTTLAHCVDEPAPRPKRMTAARLGRPPMEDAQRRVLDAHVALASLGDANKREFGDLIAILQSELGERTDA